MSAAQVIVFFAIAWWMIFFVTLPFGVERAEQPEPGADRGAPERPRLLVKAAVTTFAAAALTAAVYVAAEAGWLPLRDWLTLEPPAGAAPSQR